MSVMIKLVVWVAIFWIIPAEAVVQPDSCAETSAEPLKLLISVEQQSIPAPFPARLTLHFHNSGQNTLWFYRRVRNPGQEGSALEVRLEPEGAAQAEANLTPAKGTVLESVGLPHPKLVRLDAGEDNEEKTVIQLTPATAGPGGVGVPTWGRYRLSVIYRAKYSNADAIARNLGVIVWQGEVSSNIIEVELLPPAASAQGSAAGTVVGPQGQILRDVIVSLSDKEERLVDQTISDPVGRFSFTHLPLGLYWLTARLPNSTSDTVVFRHIQLTPAEPAGTVELVMLPEEVYEPKKLLHKPVLLRLMDAAGRPLDKVALEITWSSGTVLENVKAQVADDGTLALELIPGRNYLTLKRRGCPKDDQRVDVAEGGGIDGFKLVPECARK